MGRKAGRVEGRETVIGICMREEPIFKNNH